MSELRPYEELANAIVACAAKDYRDALRDLKKNPKDMEALYEKEDIEDFFHSRDFRILTQVYPDYLIDRLNKEVFG